MKKIFILLFSFIIFIMPLLSIAAYADDEYFSVYSYLFHGNRFESFTEIASSGSSDNYDTENYYHLGVYNSFDCRNITGTYIVNLSFSLSSIGWSTNPIIDLSSVYPSKMYLNYTDENTYDYVIPFDYTGNYYERPSDTFDFYLSRSLSSSNGDELNFLNNNITFIIKDTFQLKNIYIEFSTDVALNHINYSAYGPTLIHIDSSFEDLKSVIESVGSSVGSASTEGFQDVVTKLEDLTNQSSSDNEVLEATLEELKTVLTDIKNNQSSSTSEGLDDFYDNLKNDVEDTVNDFVDSVSDVEVVDLGGLTDSLEQLYSAVTTTSLNPRLSFPAGTVSILGTEYKLWDAQNIDFIKFFRNEHMRLILVPLRFVFYYGFAMYLFKQVQKVENLITMNFGSDDK